MSKTPVRVARWLLNGTRGGSTGGARLALGVISPGEFDVRRLAAVCPLQDGVLTRGAEVVYNVERGETVREGCRPRGPLAVIFVSAAVQLATTARDVGE